MIRVFHPGSGSCFFTHPGSRSWHRIPDPQHLKRFYQSHLRLLPPVDKHVSAGNRTEVASVAGEHSSKELFEQLIQLLFGTFTYVDRNIYNTLFLFYSPKFNSLLLRLFYEPHGGHPAGCVPAGVCQGPLPGGAAGGVARARAAGGPAAGGDRGPLLLAAAHAHGQAAGQGARRRLYSAWYIHYTTIYAFCFLFKKTTTKGDSVVY